MRLCPPKEVLQSMPAAPFQREAPIPMDQLVAPLDLTTTPPSPCPPILDSDHHTFGSTDIGGYHYLFDYVPTCG